MNRSFDLGAPFLASFARSGDATPEPGVRPRIGLPMSELDPRPGRQRFGRRICCQIVLFLCLPLLPANTSSAVPADSDHVQQSMELMSAGDLEGAEREAKLALRDSSTRSMGWATLGAIRIRQKRYTDAAECLNTALRLSPGLVGARINLGEVYALTGRKMQAREAFEAILRADPNNPDAHFALAQLESDSGNFSASLSAVAPILPDLRHSPDGILLLAKDYAGLKQKDSLLALVSDWNALPEVSADTSAAFASVLTKSSLNQQALDVLEKAKTSGEVSYEMAVALGNLYFLKGDLNGAFESYEAALSLNPGCADCLLHLAKIASQQKDPEKALAYLLKAKSKQPENAEILFEFGKACLELDLPDDALPALEKASRLQPDNDSYSYVLASANVSKKQYEAAGRLFQALLTKHPDDSVLNYAMGSLLFLEVKLSEAAKYLHKSIELQPNQTVAYYYMALVSEGNGENDQAVATLRDVLRRDSNYGLAYEALGRILVKEKKYEEAQQVLEKAVVLNPESVKAHYQLGILWGRAGRQDDASKEFEIVKQLNAEEEKRLGMRLRILTPH
jgi:tetratricopeptide (TPR) repeat protein